MNTLPITSTEQETLQPEAVLNDLIAGNARFISGDLKDPNVKARMAASANGQFPKAVILSCIDSRVPVEQIFDQGIGDLFVARVAGNIENEDLLGSMEFATKASGAKLVMVLGHDQCGAVKGACDGVELGNLTPLLQRIGSAVSAIKGFEAEERHSKNPAFVQQAVEQNVRQTVANIRSQSEILAALESSGDIKIVGAVYALSDGKVALLEC